MTKPSVDRRVTPVRADLAASSLRGMVEAPRYVDGERATVAVGVLDMRRSPESGASLDTQVLFGEGVTVFDRRDGWAWVQSCRDGYVGYVAEAALRPGHEEGTHRIIVRRTFVYPAPDMKRPPLTCLPLDARVTVARETGDFVELASGGFVSRAHLARVGEVATDPVAIAEGLIGTPYLWGGRTGDGIDCSGLVQVAYAMAGTILPRDSDMQETCGAAETLGGGPLQRGDLVFWRGHVGLMRDPATLIHANAHHMLAASEKLEVAIRRIAAMTGAEPSAYRRVRITNATS